MIKTTRTVEGVKVGEALPLLQKTFTTAETLDNGAIAGEVIAVDSFGNLVTNLVAIRGGTLEIAGRTIVVRRTYADVPAGEVIALVGSIGFVEVAVRDGNAARVLQVARGAPVLLHPAPPLTSTSAVLGA